MTIEKAAASEILVLPVVNMGTDKKLQVAKKNKKTEFELWQLYKTFWSIIYTGLPFVSTKLTQHLFTFPQYLQSFDFPSGQYLFVGKMELSRNGP